MGDKRANQEAEFEQSPMELDVSLANEGLSAIQVHYLDKLKRQADLYATYREASDVEKWIIEALSKATYSAYRDCLNNGMEDHAKQLITGNDPSE
jgi:hypothetical protein